MICPSLYLTLKKTFSVQLYRPVKFEEWVEKEGRKIVTLRPVKNNLYCDVQSSI